MSRIRTTKAARELREGIALAYAYEKSTDALRTTQFAALPHHARQATLRHSCRRLWWDCMRALVQIGQLPDSVATEREKLRKDTIRAAQGQLPMSGDGWQHRYEQGGDHA